MRVKFWGVRGSHPRPLTPEDIRNKITAVVERIRGDDLVNVESKRRFLANLPNWLFGTPGGNTPCVEVNVPRTPPILLDAGTGIQSYSANLGKGIHRPKQYHIFFTHFHYDHVQGLPFFSGLFHPQSEVHFYSPVEELEEILLGHMVHPYFPIRLDSEFTSNLHFHVLRDGPVRIGKAEISWRALNHPGGAFGYRIQHGQKAIVYATDIELLETDFHRTPENIAFFGNADCLIMDTQYTLGEAIQKYNWGHTSFSHGVEFAGAWGFKQLYLFHHEPLYDDKKLHGNLQSARWYAERIGRDALAVDLAEEGVEWSCDE